MWLVSERFSHVEQFVGRNIVRHESQAAKCFYETKARFPSIAVASGSVRTHVFAGLIDNQEKNQRQKESEKEIIKVQLASINSAAFFSFLSLRP